MGSDLGRLHAERNGRIEKARTVEMHAETSFSGESSHCCNLGRWETPAT